MADNTNQFREAFDGLKSILTAYEARLSVLTDAPTAYYLVAPHVLHNGQPVWVGGVQIMKNYVSFHLMTVYMYPDLLESVSPALMKRMQGKACFNFKRADADLFRELGQLTEAGFQRFREKGIPARTH